MQHDRGCICQECAGTSTTDTVLVGLTMIAGVVLAITTASRIVVLIALVVLAGMVVHKLRCTMPSQVEHKDKRSRKGLG